jgi:hypothetical protein
VVVEARAMSVIFRTMYRIREVQRRKLKYAFSRNW